MKISAFPIQMSESEAMKIAEKRGNLLGRMMVKKDEINMKLRYLESREIIFQMTYKNAPLPRLLGKKPPMEKGQKIRILVEGTRCMPAFLGEEPKVQEIEVDDPEQVQKTEFSDEKLISEAKYMARRMVRRQLGKIPYFEVLEMHSLYRPYYVAFYGPLVNGRKVRYLPIAADKNEVTRTL